MESGCYGMTDDARLVFSFLDIGREKALTRATLCTLSGLPDRKVRKAIESAKRAETGDDEYFIVDEGRRVFQDERPCYHSPPLETRTFPRDCISQAQQRRVSLFKESGAAVMFRCEWCGAEFDEPEIYCCRENLDGENGWEIATRVRCPYCGEEWFRRVKDA